MMMIIKLSRTVNALGLTVLTSSVEVSRLIIWF
jgi:hypothetical protein